MSKKGMNDYKHFPKESSYDKQARLYHDIHHAITNKEYSRQCVNCTEYFTYNKKKYKHLTFVERKLCVECRAKDRMKDIC